jgi:hypothetical protein
MFMLARFMSRLSCNEVEGSAARGLPDDAWFICQEIIGPYLLAGRETTRVLNHVFVSDVFTGKEYRNLCLCIAIKSWSSAILNGIDVLQPEESNGQLLDNLRDRKSKQHFSWTEVQASMLRDSLHAVISVQF